MADLCNPAGIFPAFTDVNLFSDLTLFPDFQWNQTGTQLLNADSFKTLENGHNWSENPATVQTVITDFNAACSSDDSFNDLFMHTDFNTLCDPAASISLPFLAALENIAPPHTAPIVCGQVQSPASSSDCSLDDLYNLDDFLPDSHLCSPKSSSYSSESSGSPDPLMIVVSTNSSVDAASPDSSVSSLSPNWFASTLVDAGFSSVADSGTNNLNGVVGSDLNLTDVINPIAPQPPTIDLSCIPSVPGQSKISTESVQHIVIAPKELKMKEASKARQSRVKPYPSPSSEQMESTLIDLLHKKPRKEKTAEQKSRKQGQNRTAAVRYRLKKKDEIEQAEKEADALEKKNGELRGKVKSLRHEINYLEKLMHDVIKARLNRGCTSQEEGMECIDAALQLLKKHAESPSSSL